MTEASPRQGRVFVISGPSGVGKDSVIARMLPHLDIDQVVTVTTRQPRVGEIDGVHYRFLTIAGYEAMRDAGDLLESAYVHGNWYGVPADTVRLSVERGRDVLIKVDPQGARSIKRLMPEAIFIFLRPGSLDELQRRLIGRQSETSAEMTLRLQNAVRELAEQVWFDYIVDNPDGQIEATVKTLLDIVQSDIVEVKKVDSRASSRI